MQYSTPTTTQEFISILETDIESAGVFLDQIDGACDLNDVFCHTEVPATELPDKSDIQQQAENILLSTAVKGLLQRSKENFSISEVKVAVGNMREGLERCESLLQEVRDLYEILKGDSTKFQAEELQKINQRVARVVYNLPRIDEQQGGFQNSQRLNSLALKLQEAQLAFLTGHNKELLSASDTKRIFKSASQIIDAINTEALELYGFGPAHGPISRQARLKLLDYLSATSSYQELHSFTCLTDEQLPTERLLTSFPMKRLFHAHRFHETKKLDSILAQNLVQLVSSTYNQHKETITLHKQVNFLLLHLNYQPNTGTFVVPESLDAIETPSFLEKKLLKQLIPQDLETGGTIEAEAAANLRAAIFDPIAHQSFVVIQENQFPNIKSDHEYVGELLKPSLLELTKEEELDTSILTTLDAINFATVVKRTVWGVSYDQEQITMAVENRTQIIDNLAIEVSDLYKLHLIDGDPNKHESKLAELRDKIAEANNLDSSDAVRDFLHANPDNEQVKDWLELVSRLNQFECESDELFERLAQHICDRELIRFSNQFIDFYQEPIATYNKAAMEWAGFTWNINPNERYIWVAVIEELEKVLAERFTTYNQSLTLDQVELAPTDDFKGILISFNLSPFVSNHLSSRATPELDHTDVICEDPRSLTGILPEYIIEQAIDATKHFTITGSNQYMFYIPVDENLTDTQLQMKAEFFQLWSKVMESKLSQTILDGFREGKTSILGISKDTVEFQVDTKLAYVNPDLKADNT